MLPSDPELFTIEEEDLESYCEDDDFDFDFDDWQHQESDHKMDIFDDLMDICLLNEELEIGCYEDQCSKIIGRIRTLYSQVNKSYGPNPSGIYKTAGGTFFL